MAAPRSFTLPESDGRLRRDETEQKILGATQELLDGGASLAGLSVNKIVERAGVSRATFYLHFSDKRGLVARLAEQELAEFTRLTDSLLASPEIDRDELADAVSRAVDLWVEHDGVLSSLVELAEYDSDARETWQALVNAVADRVEVVVSGRRPELSAAQARTLAQVIAWSVERVCHQMVSKDSTPRERATVAQALTDAIWRIATP